MGHSDLFFSCGLLSCPVRRRTSAGPHCVNFIAFAGRRVFSSIPDRDNKGDLLVRRLFAFWRYWTLVITSPGFPRESRRIRRSKKRREDARHQKRTALARAENGDRAGEERKKNGRYRKGEPHRKKPWQEAGSFPVWSPTRDLTDGLPTFPSRHNHGNAKKRRRLLGSLLFLTAEERPCRWKSDT